MQFEAMQSHQQHRTSGGGGGVKMMATKPTAHDDEDVLNHNHHNRATPSPLQHRQQLDDDDEEYENDSELGDDLHIDEAGNVLPGEGKRHPNHMRSSANSMAHILAGYGTDICEQLISEFVKLELNNKQLSALTDKDLELIGIQDPRIRAQMVAEFGELPNQDFVSTVDKHATADERRLAAKRANDLVLTNVYKHLNSLKTSLSVVLLRLYVRPTENVLINDHQYASAAVLRTLDEFNRSVVGMERRLLDMQYGSIKPLGRGTESAATSRGRKRLWFAVLGGICSVGSIVAMRYMHLLKR